MLPMLPRRSKCKAGLAVERSSCVILRSRRYGVHRAFRGGCRVRVLNEVWEVNVGGS